MTRGKYRKYQLKRVKVAVSMEGEIICGEVILNQGFTRVEIYTLKAKSIHCMLLIKLYPIHHEGYCHSTTPGRFFLCEIRHFT